jgi:8-oxo-dGTP pyrophosphatase MutT (NUDIX family)
MSPYVRRLRDSVGHARIFIPSVCGLVRSDTGRLLLVQSRDNGLWSTPGGAIEVDETPATAVVREVWEETGLLVRPRRLFGVYGGPKFLVRYPNGDETQYLSTMFDCVIESGQPRPDGDETMAVSFWTLGEATRLPLSPWLVDVLPRLFEVDAPPWFEPTEWRAPPSSG